MPFLPIIILVFVAFLTMMFVLRYIMTANIRKATGDLERMSHDHALKEADMDKRLNEARVEAQKIVADARKEAEETRSRVLKDADATKERVIGEAREKTEDMIVQTEKTCEILKKEILERIEKRSAEKAYEMIAGALSDDFRSRLHTLWMEEAEKADFDLGRFNVPERVQEIKLISAFPLTAKQKQILDEKFTQRFGDGIVIVAETDPGLTAGLVLTIGNVVIDGSLRNKIQRQVECKQ